MTLSFSSEGATEVLGSENQVRAKNATEELGQRLAVITLSLLK